MSALLVDIAALAEELCDPRQHTEPIHDYDQNRNRRMRRAHTTIQNGLLQQLRDAIQPSNTNDPTSRGVPKSRPPLLLEALSHSIEISIAINAWMSHTRIQNRTTNEANIRALVGHTPKLDHDAQTMLLTDLRRWRGWAAVLSGWELPPLTPHVPCPKIECGTTGQLRIHPGRLIGYCNACNTIWDDTDGSIRILAKYITTEGQKPRPKIHIGSTTSGHGGWQTRAGGTP